jgi:tRNA modification GTPase
LKQTALENSTIVAIATPPGYGGIGIVRLSGEDALPIAGKLLPHASERDLTPTRAAFHHLIHPETGQTIDDAIVTYFKAPHSFTGEDVVELSCHGSPVVLAEVVHLLTTLGAKLAEPGEFSLRAFLNHRLDLAQAEAINDLIHAQTTYQAQLALRQLHGELSRQLQPVKDALVELIVYFESSVEFVEDDLDPLNLEQFVRRLDGLIDRISHLVSSYRFGRLIRSGVRLALVGKPNVGKSSLFNRLLRRERAIVTHVPGTTRDTLTETFSIRGIPIELIDTAGLRETEDLVEKIGVERTRTAIADADFVVAVVEAGQAPSDDELEFLAQLPVNLFVINKSDLGLLPDEELLRTLAGERRILKVSALTGAGTDELCDEIHRVLTSGARTMIEGGIITSERHYSALKQALDAMKQAQRDLQAGFTEEVVLVNLHEALRSLGIVTGETLIGDIINQIFSTFCIGK